MLLWFSGFLVGMLLTFVSLAIVYALLMRRAYFEPYPRED
jgi:hypothetical protein